jgi:hypothetical protein
MKQKVLIESNIYYLIACKCNCGIEMLNEDELFIYKQKCEDCYYKKEKCNEK